MNRTVRVVENTKIAQSVRFTQTIPTTPQYSYNYSYQLGCSQL